MEKQNELGQSTQNQVEQKETTEQTNEANSPRKTRTVKFGLSKRRRLRGILVGWPVDSGGLGGGVWVPERGVLLKTGSVLVFFQQNVKALSSSWHRPSINYGMCLSERQKNLTLMKNFFFFLKDQ